MDKSDTAIKPQDSSLAAKILNAMAGSINAQMTALATQAVWGDELGGDEFDGVAVPAKQTRPVVRAGAGLQPIRHGGSWAILAAPGGTCRPFTYQFVGPLLTPRHPNPVPPRLRRHLPERVDARQHDLAGLVARRVG